jgi:hypothetical protein
MFLKKNSWNSMEHSMEFNGIPWNSMEFHGISMKFSMEFSMEFRGIQFHGIGIPWKIQ